MSQVAIMLGLCIISFCWKLSNSVGTKLYAYVLMYFDRATIQDVRPNWKKKTKQNKNKKTIYTSEPKFPAHGSWTAPGGI